MGTNGNRPLGVGLSPSATTRPPASTSILLLGYLGILWTVLRLLLSPSSTTSAESPPEVERVISMVWSERKMVRVRILPSPWVTCSPVGPLVMAIGPSGILKPKPSGDWWLPVT